VDEVSLKFEPARGTRAAASPPGQRRARTLVARLALAAETHGIEDLSPELVERAKAAIREALGRPGRGSALSSERRID